jgi:hypothetical protein
MLKSGTPYRDLGADFYARRESRQHVNWYTFNAYGPTWFMYGHDPEEADDLGWERQTPGDRSGGSTLPSHRRGHE